MIYLVFFVLLEKTLADRACGINGTLIYEDIGCKPVYGSLNSCPTSYNCPDLQKPKNKCYYKGQIYEDGESLSDPEPPSCNYACICEVSSNISRFICAVRRCPRPEGGENCYPISTIDSCCTTGSNCPTSKPFTCISDGIEYREGERFYPGGTCSRCLCQKGFSGKIEEPFCKKIDCGIQLKYQEFVQKKCAPIYFEFEDVKCCPTSWVCRDGSEIITGTSFSNKRCLYGDKHMRVGQGFTKIVQDISGINMTVSCKCLIPPLLTCTGVFKYSL